MNLKLTYEFPSKLKTATFAMMGIGALLTIVAFVMDSGPEGYWHNRFWANILINAFFFMGIGLGATFFMALTYGSEAYYATAFKRVTEAVSTWLPVAAVVLLVVIFMSEMGVNKLYFWMTEEAKSDEKVMGKMAYFGHTGHWFFWLRAIGFVSVWCYCQNLLRKRSLLEDQTGDLKLHFKNVTTSAAFLVFFGFTSSVAAWDWLMSLDVHWFSTMFGWYVFSGIWLSAMITILMLVLYLRGEGYLEYVNESHIHDLGKWVFAISFLWSYLFFCQFMLIWYANVPEEVTFFQHRWEHGYKFLMWTVFFINFALPMVFLMSRDAKRNRSFLIVICIIIFITHWLDIFFIVMPSTVGAAWGLSLITEFGPFIMFLGGMIFWILNSLSKAPMLPLKHPYLDESKHHHI
jgi:hypothetical protein